ncbi:MAG TPA: alpha/beta fold hydrolase [Baekduia sp.]|nr:alpha/beta fold hydrolase [Baekduia sp.]
MPLVEVAPDRRLNVVRRGRQGAPGLLLVQGMSGNVVHWTEPLLQALQEHFDVVAFDHRGVGWSDRVTEPFSIRDLADDGVRVLDALGLERAAVLGISMGGMVAQELALAHRERVDKLVLGCTYAGGAGSALTAPEDFAPLAEAMRAGDRDAVMRHGFDLNLSSGWARSQGAYEEFQRIASTKPASQAVIMLQLQAIGGHDTSARLPSLDVPTLVVHGSDDRMLPVANARRIAELIPGARLEVLHGAGHLFWWEQPDRVLELLEDFLL